MIANARGRLAYYLSCGNSGSSFIMKMAFKALRRKAAQCPTSGVVHEVQCRVGWINIGPALAESSAIDRSRITVETSAHR